MSIPLKFVLSFNKLLFLFNTKIISDYFTAKTHQNIFIHQVSEYPERRDEDLLQNHTIFVTTKEIYIIK